MNKFDKTWNALWQERVLSSVYTAATLCCVDTVLGSEVALSNPQPPDHYRSRCSAKGLSTQRGPSNVEKPKG